MLFKKVLFLCALTSVHYCFAYHRIGGMEQLGAAIWTRPFGRHGTFGHSRSGAAVLAPKKVMFKDQLFLFKKEKRKGSFLPLLANLSTRDFVLSH